MTSPCRQNDPELWFDTRGDAIATAKSLCIGCPVREACLKVADEFEDVYGPRWGVWGGLSANERANAARRRHEQRSRRVA